MSAVPALRQAWLQVRQNRGAPGIDGITVQNFEMSLDHHLITISNSLLTNQYRPAPLRALDIRKPDGTGIRVLGIPIVQDRLVLHAIAHILAPLWEPHFSPFSFAYRPGRSALDAVLLAQQRLQSGRHWIVDLDIEKFFDHVDHVHLMLRLRERVNDDRLLDLMGDFLRAGLQHNGVLQPTRLGIAQGSPLSPLLANIVLDELDQEYMRRGWSFVRYADDCILFAQSEAEGNALLEFTRGFLADRLNLRLHPTKTRVVKPADTGFLGFTFRLSRYGRVRRRATPDALAAFRARIQQLACANRRSTLEQTIEDVVIFFRGWSSYYQFSQDKTLRAAHRFACAQLRAYAWAYWATSAERYRQLRRLGVPEPAANQAAFQLDLPDADDDPPILLKVLDEAFFERHGLKMPGLTDWDEGIPSREREDIPGSTPVQNAAAGNRRPEEQASEINFSI